jgi:serine/threonine protein kinase
MSDLGTIGKYELKAQIGRGSSGTVYLATDSFSREDVALKVLDNRLLQDPERRRVVQTQFLNEARWSASSRTRTLSPFSMPRSATTTVTSPWSTCPAATCARWPTRGNARPSNA